MTESRFDYANRLHQEGRSLEEIAAAMGLKPASVRTYLWHRQLRLKISFNRQGQPRTPAERFAHRRDAAWIERLTEPYDDEESRAWIERQAKEWLARRSEG